MALLNGAWTRLALGRLRSRALPVAVGFWDGTEYLPDAGAAPIRVQVHNAAGLRSLAQPTLGRLARAYVEQDIDLLGPIDEIIAVGERLCDADTAMDKRGSAALSWLRHTRPAERRNIGFHYDLSNDFYALWLDARRVYSCAYFAAEDIDLDHAQVAKLDLICRKLMLREGERVLDIGCGWGGFILHAAQHYGARCTGVTLSQEQHDYVAARVRALGLSDRVEVRLQDYRDLAEREAYDKIASIGMFEHVGRSHLREYFSRIRDLLKPGGLVLNHAIAAAQVRAGGLRSDIDAFIERYVFPGGELVHIARALEAMGREQLECLDVESLRPHYALTLRAWVARLDARAEAARALVGERTYRVWRIYMAGSAHAFARGWINIYQTLAGRALADGTLPYPYRRDHVHAGAPVATSRQAAAPLRAAPRRGTG